MQKLRNSSNSQILKFSNSQIPQIPHTRGIVIMDLFMTFMLLLSHDRALNRKIPTLNGYYNKYSYCISVSTKYSYQTGFKFSCLSIL